jgi:hypothetical protein
MFFNLQTKKLVANAVLFQIGWFSCVLGGDIVALLACSIIFLLHHYFFIVDKKEWLFIIAVAVIGFTIDSLLFIIGVFNFPNPSLVNIPFWFLCIWGLFAATFNHSLSWLRSKVWAAALLGAFFAPASYFAGSNLSDVGLAEPVLVSLLVIASCWALLMPLLMALLNKMLSNNQVIV